MAKRNLNDVANLHDKMFWDAIIEYPKTAGELYEGIDVSEHSGLSENELSNDLTDA